VPLLGKIPIIDLFFRRESTSRQETELVVFITPWGRFPLLIYFLEEKVPLSRRQNL